MTDFVSSASSPNGPSCLSPIHAFLECPGAAFWRFLVAVLTTGAASIAVATENHPVEKTAVEIPRTTAFANYRERLAHSEIEVHMLSVPQLDSEKPLSAGEWTVVGIASVSPPMILFTGGFSPIFLLIGPPLDFMYRGARNSAAGILSDEPFIKRVGDSIRRRLGEEKILAGPGLKLSVLIRSYGLESRGKKASMLEPLNDVCFSVRGIAIFEAAGKAPREAPFTVGLGHNPEIPPPHCGSLLRFGAGDHLRGVIQESAEVVAAWVVWRATQND